MSPIYLIIIKLLDLDYKFNRNMGYRSSFKTFEVTTYF
jgi:hypothetical protein